MSRLPNNSQKISGKSGIVTVPWYRFFQQLQDEVSLDPVTSLTAIEFAANCSASESVGDVVYIVSSNTVAQADASSINTAQAVGIIAQKPTDTTCVVRVNGTITGYTGLTAGREYFLSTVAGEITLNVTTAPDTVLLPVGYALSSTELLLTISNQDLTIRS